MNRIIFLITLLLIPLGFNFAQMEKRRAPVSNPDAVNQVEGSFTFKGKTTRVSHAYAKMLKNDVVILFTDTLIAQKTIDDVGQYDTKLSKKAERGKVLGFYIVVSPSRQVVNFKIFYGSGPGFSSGGAEFKPALFNRGTVQGEVSTKGTFFKDEYAFSARFKVSLRPSEWTGVFYTPPPTNLEPGRASGKLLVDGKAVALNHAYARIVHNFSDEKKNKITLVLTTTPIPEEAAQELDLRNLLRAKQAGNEYVLELDLGDQEPSQVGIWDVAKLSSATRGISANFIFFPELDVVTLDDRIVEGRVYTEEPERRDHKYELDVSFKAALASDSANAPVTAGNGQPLPPGGGAPGEAYLQINRAMHAAKSARELARIKKESTLARLGASIDPDSPQKIDKETENAIFELLKSDVVDSPRVEGGFINNVKATLSIAGSLQGKKVSERQNMHLENGKWKMGAGKIEYKQ
jgi:hypothetical protein